MLLAALLVVVLFLAVLVSLKLDFDNRDRLFQSAIMDSSEGMQAFQRLGEITPHDAVIFSWWDYGRAIQDYGQRRAVVAYPSRDILQSVAASQNPIYGLEMQLFSTFESSEKIHDIASAFLLPESDALAIMRKYGATHVMVFCGQDEHGAFNDLQKFYWMAVIAGYNPNDYVRIDVTSGTPTAVLMSKAEEATMLRLLFDEKFASRHFTKLFENKVAKIYRIQYPQSSVLSVPSLELLLQRLPRSHGMTRNIAYEIQIDRKLK